MNSQKYIDTYLQTIPIPSQRTPKLFVLGFFGLPGSGKSTVTAALAAQLDLYVASNDQIRRWLNAQGFEGDAPVQPMVQAIAEASTVYLYEHHVSHIIDADLAKFHAKAQSYATAHDAQLFLIRLTTPEATILQRLQQRAAHQDELSRAGVEEFRRRQQVHNEISTAPDIIGEVDTSQPLAPQLAQIVATLRDDKGVI